MAEKGYSAGQIIATKQLLNRCRKTDDDFMQCLARNGDGGNGAAASRDYVRLFKQAYYAAIDRINGMPEVQLDGSKKITRHQVSVDGTLQLQFDMEPNAVILLFVARG